MLTKFYRASMTFILLMHILFRCWLPVPGSYVDFIYIAPILGVLLVRSFMFFRLNYSSCTYFCFNVNSVDVSVIVRMEVIAFFNVFVDITLFNIGWSSTFGRVLMGRSAR